MNTEIITQERLIELFEYKDGNLIWKNHKGKSRKGTIAGTPQTRGYISIIVDRKPYLAHRLIWMYHHGEFPTMIDHINGVTSDNRIENLREANSSLNGANRKKNKNTISKYKGITYHKRDKRWQAQLRIYGKLYFLGSFNTEEEAAKAYNKAALEHFNEYARLNTL